MGPVGLSVCVAVLQLGDNGSGKTTLLKLLMGELEPTGGFRHAHRWDYGGSLWLVWSWLCSFLYHLLLWKSSVQTMVGAHMHACVHMYVCALCVWGECIQYPVSLICICMDVICCLCIDVWIYVPSCFKAGTIATGFYTLCVHVVATHGSHLQWKQILLHTWNNCVCFRKLKIGYFAQHHVDQLVMDVTALELLQSKFPG